MAFKLCCGFQRNDDEQRANLHLQRAVEEQIQMSACKAVHRSCYNHALG